MYIQRRHWLDYDPVALAALVIGIGIIELLALIIRRSGHQHADQPFAPDLGDIIRTFADTCRSIGAQARAGLSHEVEQC
jgi:hypothetical protein